MTNINEWIKEAEKDTNNDIYKKTALYIIKALRDFDQSELEIRNNSRIVPAVIAYLNNAGYTAMGSLYEDSILVKRIVDEPILDGPEDESIDESISKIEKEKGGDFMMNLENIYSTARRISKTTLGYNNYYSNTHDYDGNKEIIYASFPKSKSTIYKIENFIKKVDTFISAVNEFKQTINKSSLAELELTNFYISKITDICKILDFKYEKELTNLEVEIFNDYYDIDSIKLNNMYDYISYVLRLKVEAFAIVEEYRNNLALLEELEQVNRIKFKFEKCNKILSDIKF